jgi:GNAT superfamily N-acetyltransferase
MCEIRGVQLIEINTDDSIIVLKSFSCNNFQDAVMLYNSGSDIRYATGMDEFVPTSEVMSRLGFAGPDDNSFAAGIYLRNGQGIHGESDAMFIGMVSGIVSGSAVWLRQLSILSGHRRKGLGSRTVQLVFEYLKQYCQVMAAFISVVGENLPGLCFWKSLGFIEISSMEKELFSGSRRHNVIIMQKKL